MTIRTCLAIALAALAMGAVTRPVVAAPEVKETKAQKDARMKWWREARFGLFIHWGLYAVPAGRWDGKTQSGPSEWLLNTAQIKVADYEPLRDKFNPVQFNARAWARLAKRAGVKYVVITSKHHEGFAMWDTKQTDWGIMHTPFHRDVLKELSAACRAEGIKFCTYHSIMDWHNPDYLPRRAWDPRPGVPADYDRYVSFLKAQLKEIVTNYHPSIMWFDGEWEDTWTHERGKDLYYYVRGLDPNIIINNRVDKGRSGMAGMTTGDDSVGDYGTPEQTIPGNGLPGVDWESCMTMNDSWGFKADDHNWKSSTTLIRNLIDCASKGGNYLLNVGPTAEGLIPQESVDRLQDMGKWLDVNGEAIYGTQASPFRRKLPWGRITQKPGRLYLHVFEAPDGKVSLPGLKNEVTRAYLLSDRKQTLAVQRTEAGIDITVPPLTDPAATVVVLDIKGAPEVEDTILRPSAQATSIVLNAEDADTHGPDIQYESDKHAIGYWTSADASVSWTLDLPHAGTYAVSVDQACEPGTAGAEYEVSVDGSSIKGTVKSTGSWTDFETVPLGDLTLPGGKITVTVKPTKKPGFAVMNLRSVTLTRK